jgi:hypothetical protein
MAFIDAYNFGKRFKTLNASHPSNPSARYCR